MTICPKCRGAKVLPSFVHYTPESGKQSGFDPDHPCSLCQGNGEITEEHAARIVEGDRLREDRVARKVSLRDEAKRLGIEPAKLSALENGRDPQEAR